MNENINLCEILKGCPKGTRLWSPIFGDVEFETLSYNKTEEGISPRGVVVKNKQGSYWYFNPDGHLVIGGIYTHEIMLFPSEDCRDWNEWQCSEPKEPIPKFDPKTLQPFDKVLARINDRRWYADFISIAAGDNVSAICTMSGMGFDKIIPYNDKTKHLVGTSDEAPEYYRYWED